MVLEEACRQWCDFTEAIPKRKDGEGFADFFYEIYESKFDCEAKHDKGSYQAVRR